MKLKVLSWNIWCGTYLDEVVDFLKSQEADIIALQEVCEDERGNIGQIIAERLGYEYIHAVGMNLPVRFLPNYEEEDKRVIKFGCAILSKYKIINGEALVLTEIDGRLVAKADIRVGENVVHVFSVHLKHTHQKETELQDLQATNLARIANEPNSIVMGDFNALSESTVIKTMNKAMQDAEVGGATPSWCVHKMGCSVCQIYEIKIKLDYIFASRDLKVDSYKVHQSKASDHLPISAVAEFK